MLVVPRLLGLKLILKVVLINQDLVPASVGIEASLFLSWSLERNTAMHRGFDRSSPRDHQ